MDEFLQSTMQNHKIITLLIVFAASAIGITTQAQDLIARQAPIDRKLASIDSLELINHIRAEQMQFPGLDIYPSWDNKHVKAYGNVELPESYTFDLTGFAMPTSNTRITDIYGYRPRRRRMHYGLDVKVNIGDTIRSAFDGKVRIVNNQGRRVGYGKYIVIRHDNGLETVYGHLSKWLVEENQLVRAGEPIALGGNTGRSTGSHLHFETRFLGIPIDPARMFNFEKQDIVADSYTFHSTKRGATAASTTAEGIAANSMYKVKKGDTLGRIAARQGVSVETLCKLNRITKKTILRPGQLLRCS